MIYLDNNATTRVAPEVLEAMTPYLSEQFGNPSSAHTAGREARAAVENARQSVADMLGAASPSEIAFTSSGTESDNWSILGAIGAMPDKKHIVATRVEHEAVRKLLESLELTGFEVSWIDVDGQGSLDLEMLRSALRPDTLLVSAMLANNETGILFPVKEIGRIVKEGSSALFHVDGVNAAGKTAIDLKNTDVDLFAISGHKFHAPKGIGALYIRDGVPIMPMFTGGKQENGRRAATEAVHQIAGLGAAARLAAGLRAMASIGELRDHLETEILKNVPNAFLNGNADTNVRLPNTSSISFENTNGEMIMNKLDEQGICVSTGSACNSIGHTASAVMQAMDIPYSRSMGSIRFSLGRYNTREEIDQVLAVLPGVVAELRQIAGQ